MSYNMSAIETSHNLGEMFIGLNAASNNLFSGLFLFALFSVLVIILLRNTNPAEAFAASSTVSVLVSLFLLAGGYCSVFFVILFMMVWGISAVALYMVNNN